jgi:hypothetical protein
LPKKKALKQTQKTKDQMTKRELSRWQKEKRQERVALSFVIGTIVLVAAILFFGLWREILSRPGQIVARVGSANVTLGQLTDEIKYRAKTLDQQIVIAQSQVSQAQAQAANDPNSSFLVQYMQQQVQQLQQQRAQVGDGTTTLQDLIDTQLIKQEVIKRGGNVTQGDIDLEIQTQFQPQPEPTAAPTDVVTDTTGITATAPITGAAAATATPIPPTETPAPSPTAIPADAWKTQYQNTLKTYNITEAEFRRFTMEPSLWRTKLQDMIGATVPTTTEQIHAFHIVFTTESDARDAYTLMTQTNLSFEDEAKAVSTDTATKDLGGDLGWLPRGQQEEAFDTTAFSLTVGTISQPISTTEGFQIIKVTEKDANHPLSSTLLDSAKSTAFTNWLTAAQSSPDIKRYLDADKLTWLSKQIPVSLY